MKKLLLIFISVILILSCNKKDDYNYLTFITAGQIDGVGISFLDIVPDEEIVMDHYGDTIRNVDLNNDGIDDFAIRRFYEHYMYSRSSGLLEIIPLGENSICVTNSNYNWVDSLKYNDTISINSNWSDTTALLYDYSWHQISPYGFITNHNGYWYESDSIYIGVKILKDNMHLFGWIEFKKRHHSKVCYYNAILIEKNLNSNNNAAQQTLYQMRVCVFAEKFEIFTYIFSCRQLSNDKIQHLP